MKTYLITGTSQGIGRATAAQLVTEGNRVIGVARNATALAELADELADSAGEFAPITFDLTERDYTPLLNELKSYPKLDGLINNVGALIAEPFEETTDEIFEKIFAINVFAPAKLCRKLENSFQTGAHVVNIGSMGGFQGSSKFTGLAAYSSAKSALSTLSECLAEEWKSKGVSVNCLALGAVQTEMLATAFPGYKAPLASEEMAEFISWFLVNGGRFFNGKVVPVALNNP